MPPVWLEYVFCMTKFPSMNISFFIADKPGMNCETKRNACRTSTDEDLGNVWVDTYIIHGIMSDQVNAG